jgi:hypothetical protein
MIENILSQTFRPLRECNYLYHRRGFDVLYDKLEEGRQTIEDALTELRAIHRVRPSSYNIQLFFAAKQNEIVQLFKMASPEQKLRVSNICKELDPGNIKRYTEWLG